MEAFYLAEVSQWRDPAEVVIGGAEVGSMLTDRSMRLRRGCLYDRMMYMDMTSYLPDDILVKVDRTAMGVSLETRVPMLDHRVVEFSWRLPAHLKMGNRKNKWLLRQVLLKYVPESLIDRPKMGFGVPVDQWIRGPLREWAEDLLSEERLKFDGFLRPKPIRQRWHEHVTGKCNWRDSLWIVLALQSWLRTAGSAPARALS
jgi:asparagine synthase (glutamine-hydrolysing)